TPVMRMPFAEAVLGRPGFLQGGAISGLLEVAAIAALRHALAEAGGGRIKPINVTVDFMRGGRDHDTLAAGIITRLGNRVANVEAV
ncbi:phenylacetic acid degradation protein, partial [Enterococcus faecium]